LEYAIRRVQENQEGPILSGTHQLLGYADDINIVEYNIDFLLWHYSHYYLVFFLLSVEVS
jgi:hypothetical protein